MKRILPSRNLIADSIELAVDANRFDRYCSSPPATDRPGLLDALARLDIPAIMVTGGR